MTSEVKEKFKNIISSAQPKKKKIKSVLDSLQDEIKEARKKGFSFKEIAEYLTQSGAPFAPHHIQVYCRDIIKEKSPKKTVKPVKASSEKAIKLNTKPEKINSPIKTNTSIQTVETGMERTLPPGFRMPSDHL